MILDVRERELSFRLPSWQKKQLSVGDAWIGLSGEEIAPGGVVVERKSADDLEASILDGRYREQRTRLLAYAAELRARPLYIIEGDLDRLYGRLQKKALLKYLTRLSLRYGVGILQTSCLDETAELLRILQEQYEEDKTVFQAQTLSYTDVVSSSRKTNRAENLFSLMIQQCPGVSAKVAAALVSHFQTFSRLFSADEKSIAEVKNGGRRIGPAVAKRLYEVLHEAAPEAPTPAAMSVPPRTAVQEGTSSAKR